MHNKLIETKKSSTTDCRYEGKKGPWHFGPDEPTNTHHPSSCSPGLVFVPVVPIPKNTTAV